MDKKKFIDFNIDLGDVTLDSGLCNSLIDASSSISIPFAFDSANPFAIKKVIELCKFKHKVIGASIVLPDEIENPLELSDEEVESIVLYQLGAINAFASAESMNIEYVRTRGVMYQLMSENLGFCKKVANAVKKFNKWLLLYGPAGNILKEAADFASLNVAHEVCLANASLTDFLSSDKLDNAPQLNRLKRLMNQSEIEVNDGDYKKIYFDTIHFDCKKNDILDLFSEAKNIVNSRPVNFNNAATSGWVE